MWLQEKGGSIYKHPYDLGPYENLTSVRIDDYAAAAAFITMCLFELLIYFVSGFGTKYPKLAVANGEPYRFWT